MSTNQAAVVEILASDEPGPPGLQPRSYTAQKLQHATPEHLYLTTRRCFIGPIPEGWLKSNRQSWYKHHLSLTNYSSRAATFSTSNNVSHRRQITGLDGPSATAMYGRSFPQPADLDALPEAEEDGSDVQAVNEEPPAVDIPRSTPQEAMPSPSTGVDDGGDLVQESAGTPSSPAVVRNSQEVMLPTAQRKESSEVRQSGEAVSFATAEEPSGFPQRQVSGGGGGGLELLNGSDKMVQGSQQTPSAIGGTQPSQASIAEGSIRKESFTNVDSWTPADASTSTASLLPHNRHQVGKAADARSLQSMPTTPLLHDQQLQKEVPVQIVDDSPKQSGKQRGRDRLASGLIRFDVADEVANREARLKLRLARVTRRRSIRSVRRGKSRPGEIVKLERMLVRVDSTMQTLPDDYDENDSLKTDSRTVEKWREFVVVCRESTEDDVEFSLQMYKTRVIPAVEQTDVHKCSTHQIALNRMTTKVNLYSSLDKTVVVWVPWKKGTMIYLMRPRSAASSVEWYTFLRNALGWSRASSLQVNVPDLSISLWLKNPFERLEASRDAAQAEKADDAAIVRTMQEEQAVAGNIIKECMTLLEGSTEWADIVKSWSKTAKMGLAWKRYDRLEWVHGINERKMYGTLAMQKSYDLELRPKQHYQTTVRSKSGDQLEEPVPVEGFLIRLTSQRGRDKRFGKMFFKRLYFASHNQFLCFCRPAKALPPPPPRLPMTEGSRIPSASQIVDKIPLIYAINPYPTDQGQITWLANGDRESKVKHDLDAQDENERKITTLLQSDGYINLCDVIKVRSVARGSVPADRNIDEGPQVDFHEDVDDTLQDDGTTEEFDDNRTFELVLKNNLIIRLQAYNKATKKEWMTRVNDLVNYWKLRTAADIALLKTIRHTNLEELQIDEEMESFIGQYADKWEVTRAQASPELHHMCSISSCRTITLSGVLFRKPRRHSTFVRCGVILCGGQVLTFQGSLRGHTGEELPYTHNERQNAINLKDCYIYSGLVTESDLLYQNQTFDSNHPGHHALPRIYLEDGWTSSDEDTTTCFVIWQGLKKSFFKSSEEKEEGKTRQRLRTVSRLGVTGRSIVFKCRSRAERDHWVMSIGAEIDRMQQDEEIRIVSKV